MKTFKIYAVIAALALTSASCVENSGKYKSMVAQRDSLKLENEALDSNYNQTLATINDVEAGFAEISKSENRMKLNIKGTSENAASRKAIIGEQMNMIKQIMEQNKARIAELQRISGKKGKENSTLTKTIKRLQGELAEKDALIQSLQEELNQKNIKIDELNGTVNNLNNNVAELNKVSDQQKATIKTQDDNINTVWYCVASTKKLKEAHILSGTGLFQKKKVMDKEFDQQAFTQGDLRSMTSIPTNSKKVTILSAHPKNSYNLVAGANKTISIEITNPSRFWSVSKYLVVQI
ncbi:ATG16 family protein [Parabacteroides sp. FAFU027]|uniref:ATG16 family protein n=1 Tax=Parabacteroides sp. FAFU027 TaxID=2922715 RepID=UPI001FAFC2DD|nr:ATG16 family protein [Parabacteroides sp. FAFU027]